MPREPHETQKQPRGQAETGSLTSLLRGWSAGVDKSADHPAIDEMPRHMWSRLARNEALLEAVLGGSCGRTKALLSDGSADVDHLDPDGFTPLMVAAERGHAGVAQILLDGGADVSIVEHDGFNALHIAAQSGRLSVAKMLVEAGTDLAATTTAQRFTALHLAAHENRSEVIKALLAAGAAVEAKTILGSTALHLAADEGYLESIDALIEAGADLDSRRVDGATPLYSAALKGRADVATILLRYKANPMLTKAAPGETPVVPLDMAAQYGYADVVRVLVQQCGIGGCGGASRGFSALVYAAHLQHVGILATLTAAGVVDTGLALLTASQHGREASVRFLLRQREGKSGGGVARYVNAYRDPLGRSALVCSIYAGVHVGRLCSPRVTRLLIDAGADSTSAFRMTNPVGALIETPLSLITFFIEEKMIEGLPAAEKQLQRLGAVRRLLLQAEAVHAVSWLWARVAAPTADAGAAKRRPTSRRPLAAVLPILKRRTRRQGVLLAALFR